MKRRHFLLSLCATTPAMAHSLKSGNIAIGHAWCLPSTLSEGQVFMPILNSGDATDALLAARSPVATQIEMRQNNRYDEPTLSSFELAPNAPFPMRPTARHLRLLGLGKVLKLGDRFPMILDFRDAGEIAIEVYVETTPGE
jgi:periplasmic copper chaperone A